MDKGKYEEERKICKSCYKNLRKIYNNNTFPRNDTNKKKIKVVDSVNNNINQTLIINFSNCGKTCFVNHILLQKQEPVFIITKSLNRFPNIKAQTSDENIQPLENYENCTYGFDDILLSKEESNFDLFFTRRRHDNIDLYYISQSIFHLPENTIRTSSNITIFLNKL